MVPPVGMEEYSERLSNDEELNLSESKNFFLDKQIKSSRRYLYQEEDHEGVGLVGMEENANYATKALPEHCDEANAEDLVIEQDIMP